MCFANRENIFEKMSRIKSRAQVESCGDCGASGLCCLFYNSMKMIQVELGFVTFLLNTRFIIREFFAFRSLMGVNKSRNSIMCRMLFDSS